MKIYKSTVEANKWFRGYCQHSRNKTEYYFCFLGNPDNVGTLIAVGTILDVPILEGNGSRFLWMVINRDQFKAMQEKYALVLSMERDWRLSYEHYHSQMELTNAFNHTIFQVPTLVKRSKEDAYNAEILENKDKGLELW